MSIRGSGGKDVSAYLLAAFDALRWVLDVHLTTQLLPNLQLRGIGAIDTFKRGCLASDPLSGLACCAPLACSGKSLEVRLQTNGSVIREVVELIKPLRSSVVSHNDFGT